MNTMCLCAQHDKMMFPVFKSKEDGEQLLYLLQSIFKQKEAQTLIEMQKAQSAILAALSLRYQ